MLNIYVRLLIVTYIPANFPTHKWTASCRIKRYLKWYVTKTWVFTNTKTCMRHRTCVFSNTSVVCKGRLLFGYTITLCEAKKLYILNGKLIGATFLTNIRLRFAITQMVNSHRRGTQKTTSKFVFYELYRATFQQYCSFVLTICITVKYFFHHKCFCTCGPMAANI